MGFENIVGGAQFFFWSTEFTLTPTKHSGKRIQRKEEKRKKGNIARHPRRKRDAASKKLSPCEGAASGRHQHKAEHTCGKASNVWDPRQARAIEGTADGLQPTRKSSGNRIILIK
jgi:hypothetical protein